MLTVANSIMRPNTLHAVYTPEPTVCRGGHFYATSTIQDTFSGLVHSYVCESFITNSTYAESRFILAEMINFYHTILVKQAINNGELYLIFSHLIIYSVCKVPRLLMSRT